MRRVVIMVIAALALVLEAAAQVAVIEETVTDIDCDNNTHAVQRFKEVRTILNEHGNELANFVCSCSKNDKLSNFKGQVTDAQGRILRKMKQSELQRTEYSQYLAIDNYKLYVEYTPPAYPVTVTYEWTIESRDNLIEFPVFCPQPDYDISVKKTSYRLKAPKSMQVRHALLNPDAFSRLRWLWGDAVCILKKSTIKGRIPIQPTIGSGTNGINNHPLFGVGVFFRIVLI